MDQRKVVAQNERAERFAVLRELWGELVRLTDSTANDADISERVTRIMKKGAALVEAKHPK